MITVNEDWTPTGVCACCGGRFAVPAADPAAAWCPDCAVRARQGRRPESVDASERILVWIAIAVGAGLVAVAVAWLAGSL